MQKWRGEVAIVSTTTTKNGLKVGKNNLKSPLDTLKHFST
jgi:hypothetical protein